MKSEDSAALLFPGQGAHGPSMLDGVRQHASFKQRYDLICGALGHDPLLRISRGEDPEFINANTVSSMLTVLASVISYDEWLANNQPPLAVAGYSIGQWTALHAAGAIGFESLVEATRQRAFLMDECSAIVPGAMMAVIGVSPVVLSDFCQILRREGFDIVVSNYNCYGQYSLAGTVSAVEEALARVTQLKPKKAIKIPTSGAWHCHLLEPAAAKFRQYMESVQFNELKFPVIDNVTGEFLPTSSDDIRDQLSRHVSNPVLWDKGLKTLISFGCRRLIEVGYGNVLTKFGFFIDRSVAHSSYYPTAVLAQCVE